MQKHLGHTTIVEKLVAPLNISVHGRLDRVANDPTPTETIKQVEPVIVHMKDEQTTRPERAMDVFEEPPTVLATANHTKCTEQADSVVEHLIPQAVQFNEVCPKPHHVQFVDLRLFLDHSQHRFRQVDTKRPKASPSQGDQGPPGAAAEIRH